MTTCSLVPNSSGLWRAVWCQSLADYDNVWFGAKVWGKNTMSPPSTHSLLCREEVGSIFVRKVAKHFPAHSVMPVAHNPTTHRHDSLQLWHGFSVSYVQPKIVTLLGWIMRSLNQLLAIVWLTQMSLWLQSNLPFTSFWHLKGSRPKKYKKKKKEKKKSERQEEASAGCILQSAAQ
jgi:hypothetical protein